MKRCMTVFLVAAFFLGWFSQPTGGASPKKSENDDSGCRALHDAGLYRSE